MIKIALPTICPKVLRIQGMACAVQHCADYDNNVRAFKFKRSIYACRQVKTALARAQNFKCAYCESKFLHASFGDIDHFRPKASWRQGVGMPEQSPGYYWLAYDISNLLFTCECCNRIHKHSNFPLQNPASRANNHAEGVAAEIALLINPREIDPADHIGFRDEYAFPVNGSVIGATTIECLGLDRVDLVEARKDHLELVRALWIIATSEPPLPDAPAARISLANLQADGAVFAGAARALISQLQKK